MSVGDLTDPARTGSALVTRFAPSPTGLLHLGHVVNAIYVWGLARRLGARVLLRLEDHDRARCRPEFEDALLEDLDWLGFVADEGRHPVIRQRDRQHLYETALHQLETSQHVYHCRCSRREIAGALYPGTCRHLSLPPEIAPALRLELSPSRETFTDLLQGEQVQEPFRQCGDLLIRDRHGFWTYHLAVTVDDIAQGVNLVIRGLDLLESTGRQLQLARMLGRSAPVLFAHHPLLVEPSGAKLSKSTGAVGIRTLRRQGMRASDVIGRAAALAGLNPGGQPVDATAVHRLWDRI